MSNRETQILAEFVDLLDAFKLPRIQSIDEVSPGLLIAAYESITGTRLPILGRRDRSLQSKMLNLELLLNSIHKDIFRFQLFGIDVKLLCSGDTQSTLKFVQLLLGIRHAISVSRAIPNSTPSASVVTSDLSSTTIRSTTLPSESTLHSELLEETTDATESLRLGSSKIRLCQRHVHAVDKASSLLDHQKKHSTRRKISVQTGRKAQAIHTAGRSICWDIHRTPITRSKDRGISVECSSQMPGTYALSSSETTPKAERKHIARLQQAQIKDNSLSFFTETSVNLTPRRKFIVDSPYKKYLKVRRARSFQNSPSRHMERMFFKSGQSSQCPLDGWFSDNMSASVRSSSDSNVSFYDGAESQ